MSESLGYFDPTTDSNAWGLPHISNEQELAKYEAWLFVKEGRLFLDQKSQKDLAPLSLDFTAGRFAHRLKQIKHSKLPLGKACGLIKGRRPSIIDATAGFAQDALLLAALGSRVTLVEQHPLIYALVADAFKRAHDEGGSWLAPILRNTEHLFSNSCDYLQNHHADVIYLDPMYPERDKAATAQVKKGMQILRSLPGCYTDTESLFRAARQSATQRVVVKRPAWAAPIGQKKPDSIVSMPNHHFDIYLA